MTTQRLEDILQTKLSLVSPRFELEKVPGGKISGSVISDTFKGLNDSERQKRIWDALEEEFGPASTLEVGTLLAYTDAEWNVDLAEHE